MVASNDPMNSFMKKMDSKLKPKNQEVRVPNNINNFRMIEKVVKDGDGRLQTEALPAFEELSHNSIDQINQSEQAIENMSDNSEIETSEDHSVQLVTSQEHKPMPSKPSKAMKATVVKLSDKSPMSNSEKKEQDRLENKAKRGLADFFESLQEIRVKKLYRERADGTKRTWEEYCLEVFGQTKQNIAKDIRANATFQEIQKKETLSSDLILTREVLLFLSKHPQENTNQVLIAAREKAGNKRIKVSHVKSVINSISPPQLQLGNKLPAPPDDIKNEDKSDQLDKILESLSEIEERVTKLYALNIKGAIIDKHRFSRLLFLLRKVFDESQLKAFKSLLYNDYLNNIGK
jgi:hypothetical protein